MKNIPLLTLTGLLLMGCGQGRLDNSRMVQEMHDREIRHVTAAEVAQLAETQAGELVGFLEKNQNPDSLSKAYGAKISKIGLEQGLKTTDPQARQVYEAYRYSQQHGQPLGRNVQKINAGEVFMVTAPADTGLWEIRLSRREIIRRAARSGQ